MTFSFSFLSWVISLVQPCSDNDSVLFLSPLFFLLLNSECVHIFLYYSNINTLSFLFYFRVLLTCHLCAVRDLVEVGKVAWIENDSCGRSLTMRVSYALRREFETL